MISPFLLRTELSQRFTGNYRFRFSEAVDNMPPEELETLLSIARQERASKVLNALYQTKGPCIDPRFKPDSVLNQMPLEAPYTITQFLVLGKAFGLSSSTGIDVYVKDDTLSKCSIR